MGETFHKIDPGIWNPTQNYEKNKVAPRNSVQNPGLKLFRALLCVRKRAFPFAVIYVLFMFCPPGDAACAGTILGICLGTPPRLGRDKIESSNPSLVIILFDLFTRSADPA